MPREKLDQSWRKARIGARIWRKSQLGFPLSRRESRCARMVVAESGIDNAAIGKALFRIEAELVTRVRCVARVLPKVFTLDLSGVR